MHYELMVILPPGVPEETTKRMEAMNALMVKTGGHIESTNVWGERNLAYTIAHNQRGVYVLWTFTLEPTAVKTLNTSLSLHQDVIRHMITVQEKRALVQSKEKQQPSIASEIKLDI